MFILILALLALSPVSDARTITVGHTVGADYWDIQDAINESGDSDTIQVWYGTYNEHIVINKSLKVESRDGTSRTFIDGLGTGVVVNITSDDVTFEGFTVQNGEIGIKLTGNNSVVKDNAINITNLGGGGHGYGIYMDSSDDNILFNNTISGVHKGAGGYGTCCYGSAGTGYGIASISATNRNIIYNNNFENADTQDGYDSGGNNAWDGGPAIGGNYWRDYTGNNTDCDGIGDTPYDLAGRYRR